MKTGLTMKLLLVAIGIATASADGHCAQMPPACGECDNLARCYLEAFAIMSCAGQNGQVGSPKMTCEEKKAFVPAYMAAADGTQGGGFAGDAAAGLAEPEGGSDPLAQRRRLQKDGMKDNMSGMGFQSACTGLIGKPYAEECVVWDMDWNPDTDEDKLKLPVLNTDEDVSAMDGLGKTCVYEEYLNNECWKWTDCFMEAAPTSETRNPFCPAANPAFYGMPTWEEFEMYEAMAAGEEEDECDKRRRLMGEGDKSKDEYCECRRRRRLMGHGDHADDEECMEMEKEKECLEEKYAPNADGLTSTGKLLLVGDTTVADFPDECRKTYWSGDVDPRKVPDFCCDSTVSGAQPFFDFVENFQGDTCATMNPFGILAQPKIASGCAADGTQFYGEKCGGSQFTDIGFCGSAVGGCTKDLFAGSEMEGMAFGAEEGALPSSCVKATCEGAGGMWQRIDDETYGKCGETTFDDDGVDERDFCKCFTYVEARGPGCFVAAVPDPKLLVLVKFEGCVGEDGEVVMPGPKQMCVDGDGDDKTFADYNTEEDCNAFGGDWITLDGPPKKICKDKSGEDPTFADYDNEEDCKGFGGKWVDEDEPKMICLDPNGKEVSKEFASYDDAASCASFGGEWVEAPEDYKEGGDKDMDMDKGAMEKYIGELVDKKLEKFEEKMMKNLMKILEAVGIEVEEEDPCKGIKKGSECKENDKCSYDKKKKKCSLKEKGDDKKGGDDECAVADKKKKCDLLGKPCKWDKEDEVCYTKN